LSHLPYSSWH